MLTLGSILALAAAALHVVIFRLESLAWGGTQARKVFGEQSPQEVAATRELAFNQGFYNLFLAVLAALGAVLVLVGTTTVGATLLLAGTGSMLAAATVLLLALHGALFVIGREDRELAWARLKTRCQPARARAG